MENKSYFYFSKELSKWIVATNLTIVVGQYDSLNDATKAYELLTSKPILDTKPVKRRSLKGLRKAVRSYHRAIAKGDLKTSSCSKEEAIVALSTTSNQQTDTKPVKRIRLTSVEKKGFYYNKKAKKFQAYFGVGAGKQLYLGLYETESDARHANLRAMLEYRSKGSVTIPFVCPKMGYYLKGNQWDVCFYNPLTKKTEFMPSFKSQLEAREAYLDALEEILGG
jgi:hypothetical protein